MPNYREKVCVICGCSYIPSSPKQKTCLNKECVVKVRRVSDRKRYKEKRPIYNIICKSCSITFSTTDSRRVYCGFETCVRKKNNRGKKNIQDAAVLFTSFGYKLLSTRYINSHTKLEYICPNGHINSMSYSNFKSGKRCPDCAGNKKHTFSYIVLKFNEFGYEILSTRYVNEKDKLKYKCPEGHTGEISWSNFRGGKRCPTCQGIREITATIIKNKFKEEGYKILSDIVDSSVQYIKYMCPDGHVNSMSWGNFNSGRRCPDCAGNKTLSIVQVSKYFSSRGYKLLSTEYLNNKEKLEYICSNGHRGFITWDNFHNKEKGCFRCFLEKGKSKGEEELYNFICGIVGESNVLANDRSLISPYELDIYVPSKKLAVEYCGLYWHSEVAGGKPRNYHYSKMKACNDAGVRLITIFEDEYKDKPEVVKSRVQNAIGAGLRRVYARNCEVKEIDTKTSKEFLLKYHLQGNTGSKVRWGLFYKGELLQVLTSGLMSRTHTGKLKGRPDAVLIELKRFASKEGVSVVGGASKLFKRLKKYASENGFTHIKSYCDMRYVNNFKPVYETLGFSLLCLTKWTPHYTKGGKRFRNQGLRKTPEERLTGLTEWELRKLEGYDRIYDCGHRTYIYEL